MKRMLTKLLVMILALAMMPMLFSACGSNQDAAPATDEAVEQTDAAAEPENTEAAQDDQAEKTVVSVEVYEDCDGSGHGVKIITYSDGTQEEVAF